MAEKGKSQALVATQGKVEEKQVRWSQIPQGLRGPPKKSRI